MPQKNHTHSSSKINSEPAATLSDIYFRITQKIIADLERGNLTWRKPWNSEKLHGFVQKPLRWNNVPYTGINTIMLWATAAEQGYPYSHWMTFNQALDLKGNVRKGEKATQVVYADRIVKEEEGKNGETVTTQIPYLKTYSVFNVTQIEKLPASYYETSQVPEAAFERDKRLDDFFRNLDADIRIGGKAAYSQDRDLIIMPPFEAFEDLSSYYSTLSHECIHWTKHPKRLDRDFGRKRFGDEAYAKEELVAELGACFLAADLAIEPTPQEDHAAYIQSWLKALQDDKRLIFMAASHAQKATEFIHAFQPS